MASAPIANVSNMPPTATRELHSTTPGLICNDNSLDSPTSNTPSYVSAINPTPLIRLNPSETLGRFLHNYHSRMRVANRNGINGMGMFAPTSSAYRTKFSQHAGSHLPEPLLDNSKYMAIGSVKSALDILTDQDAFNPSNGQVLMYFVWF